MPKTIRWGIIGAGKIAKKFASDLNTVPDSKLEAIASRSLERAEEFQKEFNAVKAYDSYLSLVCDASIDAIYIATPHTYHKAHTLLGLNHKKAVLCEKPFAMNLEEVEVMMTYAKKNNTLLMEALWTYFSPHYRFVLDLLESKHFGEIKHLKADFGFKPEYDSSSRVLNKALGGGSLLDIGIYPIFAALSTLGMPTTIKAEADFFDLGVDSNCQMHFQYEHAEAFLMSTFLEETSTEAVFTCETGTIKIHGRWHEPSSVTLIDHQGHSETKFFSTDRFGYNYEIEHFNQLIRDGKTESDVMTFGKSRELIATLDKVRSLIGLQYT